jgi:hypothetical protein
MWAQLGFVPTCDSRAETAPSSENSGPAAACVTRGYQNVRGTERRRATTGTLVA